MEHRQRVNFVLESGDESIVDAIDEARDRLAEAISAIDSGDSGVARAAAVAAQTALSGVLGPLLARLG